ncbi:MAG: FAD-dependent thymidylate synthase [Trichlorobacter sp.]|nr:FAD-dependent thymidylate synthase [Trichlorobacter sp.]
MIKIIKPEVFLLNTPSQHIALTVFEAAARTCYQSFSKAKEGSAERLLLHCIESGHHSTLEHISLTVRFITSRGVTHELVRHRLCAFSQESTRYVKYDTAAEFIEPYWYQTATDHAKQLWISAMTSAISYYTLQLKNGLSPQAARGVLPNDLKTDIVVTANLREWRHIISLRLEKDAHPDMRAVMQPLAQYLVERLPLFFSDLEVIKKRYHEVL